MTPMSSSQTQRTPPIGPFRSMLCAPNQWEQNEDEMCYTLTSAGDLTQNSLDTMWLASHAPS